MGKKKRKKRKNSAGQKNEMRQHSSMRKKNKSRNSRTRKKRSLSKKKTPYFKSGAILPDIRLFFVIFLLTITVITLVLSFFYTFKSVNGYGMLPTLRDRDVIMVKRSSDFKRFDMIVINNSGRQEIRRIIGLPGETVAVQADTLFINNEEVEEKYLTNKINEAQELGKNFTNDFTLDEVTQQISIPNGYYFVLGDNRPYTTDSRDYGFVEKNRITGSVMGRVFPLEMAEMF